MGKTGASTSALFPLKSKDFIRKENIKQHSGIKLANTNNKSSSQIFGELLIISQNSCKTLDETNEDESSSSWKFASYILLWAPFRDFSLYLCGLTSVSMWVKLCRPFGAKEAVASMIWVRISLRSTSNVSGWVSTRRITHKITWITDIKLSELVAYSTALCIYENKHLTNLSTAWTMSS